MKRFSSVSSMLLGAGIILYSIYLVAIKIFTGDFLVRNLIFLVFGFLFLGIGTWGNIVVSKKNRNLSDEQRIKIKKRAKTVGMVLGSLIMVAVLYILLPLAFQKMDSNRFEDSFRPLMKEEYTSDGVPMPENPRYILYNLNKQRFETESRTVLKSISADPKKINVIVLYKEGMNEIGSWESANGSFISTAYEEFIEIDVIRLSDWSRIDHMTFTPIHSENNLGVGEDQFTYQISIFDSQVVDYLNGLFVGK